MIIGTVVTAENGGTNDNKTSPVIAPVKQELKQNQTPEKPLELQKSDDKTTNQIDAQTNPVTSNPPPTPIVNQTPIDSSSVATPEPVVAPIIVPDSTPKQINQDVTVYGTRTGKKYHLDGCRSLGKSKIPMTLSDAKAKGLTPCSICNPPQ